MLRAVTFHDFMGKSLAEGRLADFAVIWDEDHDTRVMEPIEEIYRRGMLPSFLMFGERKGVFTAIRKQTNPLTRARTPFLETEVNAICQSLNDPWPSKVVQLSPSNPIIDDEDEKVSLYLKNIEMLWQLGSRPWAPITAKDNNSDLSLPLNPALLKKLMSSNFRRVRPTA